MNDLQWALVLLGIAVVVGVYLYSRGMGHPDRQSDAEAGEGAGESNPWDELLSDEGLAGRDEFEQPHARREEAAVPDPEPEPPEPEPPRAQAPQPTRAVPEADIRMPKAPPGEEKLLVLHVAADRWLEGQQIHDALKACGLHFGPRHIYHRIEEVDGIPESVFCVANMLKPGYLDPAEAGELRTRGLSLFMVLPGPLAGVRAYRNLLETANDLAGRLEADVLDDRKTPLNKQMAQYLHEEIVEFERRRAAHA